MIVIFTSRTLLTLNQQPCGMCLNARVDEELTEDNDYSAYSVGESQSGFRLMLCSGAGKPTRIEAEMHTEHGWGTVAVYEPKYCPNCGRSIMEYAKKEKY